MINTSGAYILVLIYTWNASAMITIEFPNYDSCKAAITQLEPVHTLQGYCIAKEVQK